MMYPTRFQNKNVINNNDKMTEKPSRGCGTVVILSVCLGALAVALILALIFGLQRPTANTSQSSVGYQSVYKRYRYAAVTTDTNVCSTIGTDILGQEKGSVVDAAIATYLCVCVVNPHSCGIGGGFFGTIYEAPLGSTTKSVKSIIARERAPGAADKNLFINKPGTSLFGGLAIGVPGEVAGFYAMWSEYGLMPWQDLFTEAIRLCEFGSIVENSLAQAVAQNNLTIKADPNLSELFMKGDGQFVQIGDVILNPKLGTTLRRIAADPMTFYNGSLAADIIADLADSGSIITLADLKNYVAELKDPIVESLNNGQYTVYNPPPPSSGVVLSFILNVLDGYNFSPADFSTLEKKTLTYHRITEAFKFAYAKRSELGDIDFVNVSGLLANLTSKDYGEQIRRLIDDNYTHDVAYYGPTFDFTPDAGTAHVNILAPDGGAVAITGTINLSFGAKVRGRRTGIIFNDEMDDFSTPGTVNNYGLPASPSNYIVPGKIPMSSMSPTIVQDASGNVVLLSGAGGGTIIITATAFVSMNSLWFGLDLKESTDTARIHHQLVPNVLQYESWLNQIILKGLQARNHSTQLFPPTTLSVIGAIRDSCLGLVGNVSASAGGCIEAVSDGRKGGTPDGF